MSRLHLSVKRSKLALVQGFTLLTEGVQPMGMYSAMMKQVHEHAKKLEKSGQLDRMFQTQEPTPSQQPVAFPLRKQEQDLARRGK